MEDKKVKCVFCKNEIFKKNAYKHINEKGNPRYYCSEEHYSKYQNKIKFKPKKETNDTSRRKYTDTIQDLYLENGFKKENIPWQMLMAQTKKMMEENIDLKYSGISYTLNYMDYILKLNLFDSKFNGSILNLVPFYYQEAKEYWEQYQKIKKDIENFELEENVTIIKVINTTSKIRKSINTEF